MQVLLEKTSRRSESLLIGRSEGFQTIAIPREKLNNHVHVSPKQLARYPAIGDYVAVDVGIDDNGHLVGVPIEFSSVSQFASVRSMVDGASGRNAYASQHCEVT
jgi:hypothetical protein